MMKKGWLNESGAKYPVEVAILKDNVLLTIDTSGSGLNRRGYHCSGEVLLKKPGSESTPIGRRYAFIDPFCGSVLAIEACLIAQNIAPGVQSRFCF